jgi:chromosome segregation ATPase
LRIGDETVSGDGERQLLEATTLTLPGCGRLRIEPGGSDIAALARDAAELYDRHASALSRLGLASFDAAEARQQLHALKLSDLKAAQATLKALAPNGVDALRAECAALDARTTEVQQRLDAHGDEGGDTLPSVAEAESAEDIARRSATEAARQLAAARNGCAAAQAALEAAQRERDAARTRLDDPARASRWPTPTSR